MLKLYNIKYRHLIVWFFGLGGLLVSWLFFAIMFSPFGGSMDWSERLFIFALAAIFSTVTQIGFIISPLVENRRSILLTIFTITLMAPAIFIFSWILCEAFNIGAILEFRLLIMVLDFGSIFVLSMYLMQIFFLLKSIFVGQEKLKFI